MDRRSDSYGVVIEQRKRSHKSGWGGSTQSWNIDQRVYCYQSAFQSETNALREWKGCILSRGHHVPQHTPFIRHNTFPSFWKTHPLIFLNISVNLNILFDQCPLAQTCVKASNSTLQARSLMKDCIFEATNTSCTNENKHDEKTKRTHRNHNDRLLAGKVHGNDQKLCLANLQWKNPSKR